MFSKFKLVHTLSFCFAFHYGSYLLSPSPNRDVNALLGAHFVIAHVHYFVLWSSASLAPTQHIYMMTNL